MESTCTEQRNYEVESVYIHESEYIEGWYSGEMENGLPNGIGHLEYDLEEDGYIGCLWVDGIRHRALSYQGEFVDGYRNGQGTLVYEGNIRDVGTFYTLAKGQGYFHRQAVFS